MKNETEIAVLDSAVAAMSPKEVVAQNKERADALIQVVNQTESYQRIGGKNYLMVEAWQLIGRFDSATAITAWSRPLVEDGEEIGQEARVEIWKHGEVVGGAEMACGYDEFVCRGKEGVSKKNAAKSMAQTRATSKAFRMVYSFVAVLAGYQPTPAEEMSLEPPQRPVQRSTAPRRPTPPPVVEAAVREATTEAADPSSLHVPEEVTRLAFQRMCEESGWGQADVIGLLGSSAMAWIREDKHRTYRTAWLACVEAASS